MPLPHQAYVIKLVPTDYWKTEPLSCEMQFIELELPRRLIFAVVQPRWCGLLLGSRLYRCSDAFFARGNTSRPSLVQNLSGGQGGGSSSLSGTADLGVGGSGVAKRVEASDCPTSWQIVGKLVFSVRSQHRRRALGCRGVGGRNSFRSDECSCCFRPQPFHQSHDKQNIAGNRPYVKTMTTSLLSF